MPGTDSRREKTLVGRLRLFGKLILVAVWVIRLDSVAAAQPGSRHFDFVPQVLDALFPLEASEQPYLSKLVLRFGDTNTQLTVVMKAGDAVGSRCEATRLTVTDLSGNSLNALQRTIRDNPGLNPKEIAAMLKIQASRSAINCETDLLPALKELTAIRISPALAHGVSVDDFFEYEFRYDTWQTSVHYTIVSPFGKDPEGKLGKWMLKVRSSSERWFSRP